MLVDPVVLVLPSPVADIVIGRDEPFQTVILEIVLEILHEIAPAEIVAWAIDNQAFQFVAVMLDFLVNVLVPRVKLVVLGNLGLMQISVLAHSSTLKYASFIASVRNPAKQFTNPSSSFKSCPIVPRMEWVSSW